MHRTTICGILPIDKPVGVTSFSLVSALRKLTHVKTIGHAGTLDPFASGVMILLIGKEFTKRSNQFLTQDKEYLATLYLGKATDTYDTEGQIISESLLIPTRDEVEHTLLQFQGTQLQVPPMFSAKKIDGKNL
jgi:tRNA pseudouridine55 synthase